jgi:hypothetical protein
MIKPVQVPRRQTQRMLDVSLSVILPVTFEQKTHSDFFLLPEWIRDFFSVSVNDLTMYAAPLDKDLEAQQVQFLF